MANFFKFFILFALIGCSDRAFKISSVASFTKKLPPIQAATDGESLINLTYNGPESSTPISCSIIAPPNFTITTPCSCSLGVCTVGLTENSGLEGKSQFSYVMDLDEGGTSKQTVQEVEIVNVGLAPVAVPSPHTLAEDIEEIISLNYTDPEGDLANSCTISSLENLSVTKPCACTMGACTVGVTGTANYFGPASFDFKITSNNQTSSTVTNPITITPVDDAPTVESGSSSALEDIETIITLNYTDVDNDQASSCTLSHLSNLTVTTTCSCASGVCSVGVTGTENYFGDASFQFLVSANGQDSNQATYTVSIASVDDLPVASNIFPPDGHTNRETIIDLSYTDADGDLATSCSVSDLSNLTVTTPCSCISSSCSVGVTGIQDWEDVVSFQYSVTANGATSNLADVHFSIVPPPERPFISRWRVGTAGYGNGNNTITLPLRSGFFYDITVDWGDGSPIGHVTSYNVGNSHTYGAPGDYTVTIKGIAQAWYSYGNEDKDKLIEVVDFGDLRWTDLTYAFANCKNLQSFAGGVTADVTNMTGMFSGAEITSMDLSNFNTSKVTNMREMFYVASKITSLDLSSFNTSKVTNMSGMFNATYALTSLDISRFNTSNVTNMNQMFFYASKLTSLDLSHFDTAKVTNMNQMFNSASELVSLDISNFDTSKVYTMKGMFFGTNKLANLDLSSFDTSNVTDMSEMFYMSREITSLDLSNFDTSKVTDMRNMFAYTSNLINLYTGSWDVDHPISSLNIWNGTNPELALFCTQPSGTLFGKSCK